MHRRRARAASVDDQARATHARRASQRLRIPRAAARSYLEEWLGIYSRAPRRFAVVNTNIAHEHYMLRLPALDADLAELLERLAPTVLQARGDESHSGVRHVCAHGDC